MLVATVVECVVGALEPYVGSTVADTCVRATALSMGKTADSLDRGDIPSLAGSIRTLLAPVAAAPVIDSIIAEIERRCS